jgi:hypothetical protein
VPGHVPMLLIAPAAGLLVDAALHMLLARVIRGLGPIRIQFLSFAVGGLITVAILAGTLGHSSLTAADKAGLLVLHVLIYACYGFCFFNVVSANVSSLRVRLIKELLAQDPAPIRKEILYSRYSAREMVFSRLKRLESGGQIRAAEGRYYLRRRGIVAISTVFTGLRQLLLGR